MKKALLTYFTLFVFCGAFAQYKTIKSRAGKAFQDKDYYRAAYYYDLLAEGKSNLNHNIPFNASVKNGQLLAEYPFIRYRLAESYRLYQDFGKAQEWYAKVLAAGDTVNYPLTRLWYGVCLRTDNQFDKAIRQLQQFKGSFKGKKLYADIADREIADCELARKHYGAIEPVRISRMDGRWNADGGSYGLARSAGNYWFTSSRVIAGSKNAVNHIYRVSGSGAPEMVALNSGDGQDIEYGSAFFDAANKRLYVTGRYRSGDQMVLAIFYANSQNNRWSQFNKLNANVNADGYNAMQPFVTPDGKRLFFSSDKPGGVGGYDIWVSNLEAGGDAADAVNLGKVINTPMDDETPFYDAENNRLNYSSKGFTGLGGFDVYESNENNGQWSAPVNLGYPVNSSKDDLYYFADPDEPGKFYLSSDRDSECCLSLFIGFHKPLIIAGTLTVCDTSATIAGVKVSLADSLTGSVLVQTETGPDGKYSFGKYSSQWPVRKAYKLSFEKRGYFTKNMIRSWAANLDTLITEDACLEAYIVNKPILIKNILYDFDKARLSSVSSSALNEIIAIMKDNPGISIEISSYTDSMGGTAYNLKLSQQRAQACADYIVSKGIDRERIVAKGYGEAMPVAPNSLPDGKDNPEGRRLNRRTEFKVIGQKQ